MPGFDRTGPEGRGPMTGRGLGRCRDPKDRSNEENFDDFPRGQGRGRGFGFGRGRGHGNRRGFGWGRS